MPSAISSGRARTARRARWEGTMAKLDRDGVKIHYEVHGPEPEAQRLLLSHGYSSTCAHVGRPGRRPEGPLPGRRLGHARPWRVSDYPADQALYSEALTVGDMAALLDLVGAKPAIIAGLSLGGYMSLAFHASHPDRVQRADAVRHRAGLQEGRGARQVERDGPPAGRPTSTARGLAALNSSDEAQRRRAIATPGPCRRGARHTGPEGRPG